MTLRVCLYHDIEKKHEREPRFYKCQNKLQSYSDSVLPDVGTWKRYIYIYISVLRNHKRYKSYCVNAAGFYFISFFLSRWIVYTTSQYNYCIIFMGQNDATSTETVSGAGKLRINLVERKNVSGSYATNDVSTRRIIRIPAPKVSIGFDFQRPFRKHFRERSKNFRRPLTQNSLLCYANREKRISIYIYRYIYI